jgi:hypothetical protein
MKQTSTPTIGVSRALLLDIATRSSLDDASLSTVCAMRPDTVSVISYQVLYVAAVLSQLRACHFAANRKCRVRDLLSSQMPEARRPRGVLAATPSQLRVVVIGGGTVGRHIVSSMLTSGMFHPSALSIITRQPATLKGLSEKGVRCFPQDDVDVLRTADLVILAVQPSQIYAVGKRCVNNNVGGTTNHIGSGSSLLSGANPGGEDHQNRRSILRPNALVVSVCCGVTVDKVCGALQHDNCLTTYVEVGSIAAAVRKMSEEAGDEEQQARSSALSASHQQQSERANLHVAGIEKRKQTLLELAFPRDGSWSTPPEQQEEHPVSVSGGHHAAAYGSEAQDDIGDRNDEGDETSRRRGQEEDDAEDGDVGGRDAYFHSSERGGPVSGSVAIAADFHNHGEYEYDDDHSTPQSHQPITLSDQRWSGGSNIHLQRQHHQPLRAQEPHRPEASFYFLDRFLCCLMRTQQHHLETPTTTTAAAGGVKVTGGGSGEVLPSSPSSSTTTTTTSLASIETLITTWALLLPEGPLRKRMLETCDASEIQRALVAAAAATAAAAVGKSTTLPPHDESFQELVATVLRVSDHHHEQGSGTHQSLRSSGQHHHNATAIEALPTVQWCSAVLLREQDPFVVVDELQKQFLRLLW